MSDAPGAVDPRVSRAGLAVAVVAAVVQLAPVLGRGYVVLQDMVFVPKLPLNRSLLGVGGVPRAVPSDLLLGLSSRVLPAWVIQDLVLAAIIVLAGWGTARLVPTRSAVAGAVASLVAAWCPWLAERLLLGQWALLLGFAALPWALRAARDVGAGQRRAAFRLGLWLIVAAAGGAAAELAAVLPCLLLAFFAPAGRRLPSVGWVLGFAVLLGLPWIVPSLLLPGGVPTTSAGVTAFKARADTPFGTWGSVFSLGGVWDGGAVPASRGSWPGATLALVISVAGVAGLLREALGGSRFARGLLTVAGSGLVLAVASATPGLSAVARVLVVHVPGGGLGRDAQKWSIGLVPAVAVGAGLLAAVAVEWLTRNSGRPAVALGTVVMIAAPVVALPGAAWGLDRKLVAVDWPSDWSTVRSLLASDPRPGAVVALPWAAYRQFPWNSNRPQADPAPRWVSGRRTASDDRLVVGTKNGEIVVPGENAWDAAVTGVVSGTGPITAGLERLGIGWVLLERTTPGAASVPARLPGASIVYAGPELEVWHLPDRPTSLGAVPSARVAHVAPVVAGDVLAALATLGLLAVGWDVRMRRHAGDDTPKSVDRAG